MSRTFLALLLTWAAAALADPPPRNGRTELEFDGIVLYVSPSGYEVAVKPSQGNVRPLWNDHGYPVRFPDCGVDYPPSSLRVGDRVRVRWAARHGAVASVTVLTRRNPDAEFIVLVEGWVVDRSRGPYEGVPPHIQVTCQALGDRRYARREQAQQQLIRMGPECVRALVWAGRDRDGEIRDRAGFLLSGYLGDRP